MAIAHATGQSVRFKDPGKVLELYLENDARRKAVTHSVGGRDVVPLMLLYDGADPFKSAARCRFVRVGAGPRTSAASALLPTATLFAARW